MRREVLNSLLSRYPAVAYVAPFATFLLLLAAGQYLPPGPQFWYPVRVLAASILLVLVSRRVLDFRVSRAAGSVLLGAAVFVIWAAPDLIWPGYRSHWLFQNSLTGVAHSSVHPVAREHGLYLVFRVAGSALLVPILEELFWRAWLMRYAISRQFEDVPLGAYSAESFWITAVLFASEHGPYWDVGLLAGVAYNWWMLRTRSLGDCILAHAVTNGLLAAYVLRTGRWEFWM